MCLHIVVKSNSRHFAGDIFRFIFSWKLLYFNSLFRGVCSHGIQFIITIGVYFLYQGPTSVIKICIIQPWWFNRENHYLAYLAAGFSYGNLPCSFIVMLCGAPELCLWLPHSKASRQQIIWSYVPLQEEPRISHTVKFVFINRNSGNYSLGWQLFH